MKAIEFELVQTVAAPPDQVFARLVDIAGYATWMPAHGSMLKRTRQTSAGAPGVGTTYEDDTTQGTVPGEITVFDPPHTIVFHWWARSRSGRLKYEGSPGYSLEPDAGNATLVRHHATLQLYGVYVLAAPIFRRLALRERTATLEALKASFA